MVIVIDGVRDGKLYTLTKDELCNQYITKDDIGSTDIKMYIPELSDSFYITESNTLKGRVREIENL